MAVPIAPHSLTSRPFVVASPEEGVIEIVAGAASASFDMFSFTELHVGDRVTVRRAEHSVRFLHPKGWSFSDTLRKKLYWNAGH